MGSPLRIRLFGDLRVDGVDLSALRSRKARTVVKVLALDAGAAVPVDRLVDAVWGDDLPADPARDLSVLVSRARSVLGAEHVVRRDRGYVLLAEWCDRDEVRMLTQEASRRASVGDHTGARAAAEAALAVGAQLLLADEADADWVSLARAESAAVLAQARAVAGAAALTAGHDGDAAAHGTAALRHDPYDEAALRLLMQALTHAGRPASALAAYAEVRARLADDLGVSPSSATEAVHAAILAADGAGPTASVEHRPAVDRADADLIGRSRELGRLDALLERARSRSVVAAVVGEAGVGKTRVLEAWTAAARARGVLVMGASVADGPVLALQPVRDALGVRVPASTVAPGPASAGWAGLPGPVATAGALQHDVFAGLAATLRAVAPPGGIALCIDDAHFADAMTVAWLAHLVSHPEEVPLLVVLAARSDESVELPCTERITIQPFDLGDVTELVGAALAPALWRRTGGNPLLVVELAAAAAVGADGDRPIPATVRDAVVGRLRRAGPAALTIRTAALLGSAIDLDLLAGVLDESPLAMLEHLDDAVRRGFVHDADGSMVFRHELVREALDADATAARRTWVHRRAASILASRPDANPLELARHARAGGDLAAAAAALADAADVARGRFDLAGAEHLLDDAIGLRDSADLRLRRSRLRLARNDLEGADRDAEVALGYGAGARALELRAWVARNRHDMETAIRLGTAGADAGPVAPGPGEEGATTTASCLVAVGLAHRGLGDLAAADAALARAAALRPDAALGIDAWIGVLRVHQGRPVDALAALEPMVGAEAGGLLSFWVEHVLQMLAHAYGHLGRAVDALALLDRLDVELARRGSASRYDGATSAYRSWILRNLGAAGAVDAARDGVSRAASTEVRAQAQLDLADTLLGLGRVDDAGAMLGEARAGLAARWFHNRWRFEQRAGLVEARVLLTTDRPRDALEVAEVATEAATLRGDARYATLGRLVVARARARAGVIVDAAVVERDLDALARVAALEAWWMAADVAADTGIAAARTVAGRAVDHLLRDAGEHGAALRRAASMRIS